MKTKLLLFGASLPLIAALTGSVRAAEPIVPVAGTYAYTQNFNTMFMPATAGAVATAGATNWTDGVTVPNWWFHYSSNVVANVNGIFAGASFIHSGNDGSAAPTLTLNSAGPANNPNRFIAAPSTTARAEQSGIVVFRNDSTFTVELTGIKYKGRVLRTNSTANSVESVLASWRVGASEAAILTMAQSNLTAANAALRYPPALEGGPTAGYYVDGWNLIPAAHFTYSNALAATPVNESIDKDAAGLSGIKASPGQFFGLRFANVNNAGTDGLLGIDDLELTFTEVNAAINATVSGVSRLPGVDGADPLDDTINFTLTVTGAGAVGAGWDVTTPAAFTSSGTYGLPTNITGVPISTFNAGAHVVTGTAVDNGGSGATADFTVTAPWTSLTATGNTIARGAGNNFTANLNVSGTYVSNSWTTNAGAIVGLPASGAYGVDVASGIIDIPVVVAGTAAPIAQVGPFTVADSAVVGSDSPNLYLLPPMLIGKSTVPGTAPDVISDGRFISGDTNQVTWGNDPAIPLLQMADGDAGGAGLTAKRVTATYNLAGVAGPVLFSMKMIGTDGSSGFEAADTFAARLVYNLGGVDQPAVNLVTSAHETQSGFATAVINGILADDEIAAANTSNTFDFSAVIPDNIQSVRVEIDAISDSGYASEHMIVQDLLFAPAPPGIQASGPTNVLRVENGPGSADDTVTFTADIIGINGGPTWTTSDPVTPNSGAFGVVNFTIPAPLPAGPLTVTFTDPTIVGSSAAITVPIPARAIIGQRNFGGGLSDVATSLSAASSALWVNDAALRTHTIIAGIAAQTETVLSEVLDLTAVDAALFSATVTAADTSAGSNYEVTDKLKIELIIDGGLATEQIVNLSSIYDAGDGLSAVPFVAGAAVPNGPPDGWINGYSGTISAADGFATALLEYNAHLVRDEFNRTGVTADLGFSNDIAFGYSIPAAASTVQLRLTSQGIQGTETAILKDVLFALSTGGPADTDGDGQTDAAEALAGTNPNDPADYLHVSGIVSDGAGGVNVTFPSKLGIRYQAEVSPLLNAGWTTIGPVVDGTGGPLTAPVTPVPVPGESKYFLRIRTVP